MRHPITKKPEKVRTHTRYELRQQTVKRYVKCQCGTPIILNHIDWTTCPTCDNKFKTDSCSQSQPHDQKPTVAWPTPLKKFYKITSKRKDGETGYGVAIILDQTQFVFGRHTKKLFKEIEELDGEVRIHYDVCSDGRQRPSSFDIEYWRNGVEMKGGLSFIWPENRSNKVINEHLNYFLTDLRSLTEFKDKYGIARKNSWDDLRATDEDGNIVKWKPENYTSADEVCTSSRMEYSY